MDKTLEILPEQDTAKTITMKYVRHKCDICDKDAHYKHTWLLKGTRSNPQSSAYRRDDCSWCEDAHSFTCRIHKNKIRPPEGYVECSIFSAVERFAHLFLYWKEIEE